MEVVLATHNKHKILEIQNALTDIFGDNITILTPTDIGVGEIEENGTSFEENSIIKAEAVWKSGRIAIADDSGVCVNALNGAPGLFSARYAGEPTDDEKNNRKLLSELKNCSDRSAYYICVIACILPDGRKFTVEGRATGVILEEYVGTGGFGYDPLFLSDDLGKTFAETTREEKNSVSHRGRALQALKEKLSQMNV